MAVKTVQAIINGQTHTLTYNESTKRYEATITAPAKSSYPLSGHYYSVTIKATDDANNTTTVDATHETLGESLRLKVREKTAPVITITYPTASAVITNNKPVITWKVTDDDSGVNPSTIGITIDSETKITGESITKKAVSGGYECSYTPATALTDGSHTIKVDASDFDGNAAVQKSVVFKVDTVPPTLNITSPADGMVTNNTSITLTGKTNDITSSPVILTYQLNGGSETRVDVNTNGDFSVALTAKNGDNTLVVKATDSAGKETIVTRHFKVDTGAPVIHSATITPNPVDAGKTYVISVEVTD